MTTASSGSVSVLAEVVDLDGDPNEGPDPVTAIAVDVDSAEHLLPVQDLGDDRPVTHVDNLSHLFDRTKRVSRLKTVAEILAQPDPEWRIDGILSERAMAVMFAQEGTYKSFIALNWAFSIATGRPWCGRTVKPGPVAYIIAEGQGGLKDRIRAWLHASGLDREDLEHVRFITTALPLTDPDTVTGLLTDIRDNWGESPVVTVIDTLARCYTGDENSTQDMGQFIKQVQRIQDDLECAVVILHHEPSQAEKPRGSTALAGAADCLIRVYRPGADRGVVKVKNSKQKDAPEFADITLKADVVDLGDGHTSLIMTEIAGVDTDDHGEIDHGCDEDVVELWQPVRDAVISTGSDGASLTKVVAVTGMARTTVHRHLGSLVDQGALHREVDRKGAVRYRAA